MDREAKYYIVCCHCTHKWFSRTKQGKCPQVPPHKVMREKIPRTPPMNRRG